MKTRIILPLLGIIFVYLFISNIGLLTKDPPVFTDEVSFSTYAYQLVNPSEFGSKAFENRLTIADEQISTLYGPVYPVLSGLFYKLFGLSIYTVRGFSVLVGALTLIALFYLLTASKIPPALSLLTVLLVSLDMNFLRSARFGRPEILLIFFTLLAFLYYLHNSQRLTTTRYIILATLISLSLFTHFYLGLIVLLVISAHLLLTNPSLTSLRNLTLFVFTPLFLTFLLWYYLLGQSPGTHNLKLSTDLLLHRLIPDLFLFKVAIRDRLTFNFLTLVVYALSFVALLHYTDKTTKHQPFWVLLAIISFSIVAFGSAFMYAGILPLVFLPLIIITYHHQVQKKIKNETAQILLKILIGFFFLLSLFQLVRLWNYHNIFSYPDYGQKVSACIPDGDHKVYLTHLMTYDPYLYLVANRPKLSLAYRKYQDSEGLRLKKELPQADYAVVFGRYALAYQNQLTTEETQLLGLDPLTTQFLLANSDLVCTIITNDNPNAKAIVVKVKK